MKIAVASDHAGYALKETIKRRLADRGEIVNDFGAPGPEQQHLHRPAHVEVENLVRL